MVSQVRAAYLVVAFFPLGRRANLSVYEGFHRGDAQVQRVVPVRLGAMSNEGNMSTVGKGL